MASVAAKERMNRAKIDNAILNVVLPLPGPSFIFTLAGCEFSSPAALDSSARTWSKNCSRAVMTSPSLTTSMIFTIRKSSARTSPPSPGTRRSTLSIFATARPCEVYFIRKNLRRSRIWPRAREFGRQSFTRNFITTPTSTAHCICSTPGA